MNHEPGTGPEECLNCAYFGCIDDVFIGYCANCAINIYEGSRGRGFIEVGIEYHGDNAMQFPSVFDTYLKDVMLYRVENEIPEPYDNTDTSAMDCHFEGGYNDF